MPKKRALSGIQTSGDLHLGNYLGAIQPFVAMQKTYDCFFFLADLHAITVPQDPENLRRQIRETAAVYIAAGLDPERVTIFRQSMVSPHAELGWLLNTIATMGELSRMTQYKDKAGGKEDSLSVGLFDYPVLQAADILLYQPQMVPVGRDQKQHVELTRDLAERFNKRFGETFVVPEPLIREAGALIMGLDDPTKKMSKSAPSELNRINLTDSAEAIQRKISKAVTDSGEAVTSGDDKPALTNLLTIFSLLDGRSIKQLEQAYAGKTYHDFKTDLTEVIIAGLTPIQQRLTELEQDDSMITSVLEAGADKARPVAEATLAQAKQALGL
jgi:tryptophanyl-tRNA synthetase